jgi:hypothetical protein
VPCKVRPADLQQLLRCFRQLLAQLQHLGARVGELRAALLCCGLRIL